MLIPNILSDNFCRYFVANRTDKVTVIPEFPSPKFLLYLGEFSKHHLRRYAFDYLHYPRWSILRWHNQKQMHMIIHCFHRIYFKFISLCDLTKYLFQPRRHSIAKQLLSIFWYPYKMILQIVDAMLASSQWAHSPYCNIESNPDFVRMSFSSQQQSCWVFQDAFINVTQPHFEKYR